MKLKENKDEAKKKIVEVFKEGDLIPAIIQDIDTRKVLMLGYMNLAAYQQTMTLQKVTFYSRSKKRLWTKGEESGHFLKLIEIKVDCDADTLLVFAQPEGPVCHTGYDTCWGEENETDYGFLSVLEAIIDQRKSYNPSLKSYVSSLFKQGVDRIAQKVGEEAVETVIAAKNDDTELFIDEAADLLFHYLILLSHKKVSFREITAVLQKRHLQ
ncbi:bifunctional phosphoribosyl-AMP cyclohydrolase/phosphoribosyl-ATP diphosphatase HisIE [Mesonia sp. K7]|uniref:bifunctional phosphoribosyl-AMP cyclohydrolase/phosphoribosyl-ATP diphosphatase HisIE n=1 Tax=Mesonia sp. K7 TaxID=2218606 RepID=UPI000DA7C5BF|nr:bifunctional phosphoribosyl-AMP cyclohydrolase/phosphoribosyl-ATP diphosphatase HisIE [Mesonia sp. K7]PZD76673.1 bifunctional phosphoribosyl-AMP cyclohydrolase/phosphoribosyl-ATP diphosphatase [Mesonia sp. K7]